jgi:outer membrane protein assembly factor BamB
MLLAVLVVVLLVATIASGYLFIEEREKPKDVESGTGISQVAFVREGVVVELDQEEDIDTLTLYDSTGDQISKVDVGRTSIRILADLEWVPFLKYRFDVKLKSGDVLSTPAYAPERPVPYKLFEISYADEFPVEEYHASVSAHSHTEAVVQFSKDGTRVAVGGLEGRISVIDISKEEEIWVKRLDDLSIESVVFSDDGTKVLVGGHHLEYRFHCLDAATGEEIWRKDVKSEVGETEIQSAPSTYLQTNGDRVWMGVSASWTKIVDEETRSYMTEPRNTSRILHYRSKMYCYNLAGEQIWTFPVDGDADYDDWGGGVMDRGIMQDSIMVDDAGEYLSVAFSSRNGDTSFFDAQLVVFDAQEGDILWNWSMPIIKEFSYRSHITNAWMSPDGKYIALGSMDGRGYLFDNAENVASGIGQPEWSRNLGVYQTFDGIITHTSDICPYTDGETVIFHVARTQDTTSQFGNSKTNIIYGVKDYVAFDLDGDLEWTFKVGETRAYTGTGRYGYGVGGGYLTFGNEHQEISGLTQDSSTMHYTYYIHPTRTESYFTVLDLDQGSYDGYSKMEWRVRLDGSPATQGDVSDDGWYVCIAESPVDKDPTGSNPDYHGIYRVMIYV